MREISDDEREDARMETMTMTQSRADIWRRIEAEARDQVRTELDALVQQPLVYGDYIAWTAALYGRTDGLSEVHRVGVPIRGEPATTCNVMIPAPALWLPLSPAFMHSLGPCRFCEAEYARQTQGAVA